MFSDYFYTLKLYEMGCVYMPNEHLLSKDNIITHWTLLYSGLYINLTFYLRQCHEDYVFLTTTAQLLLCAESFLLNFVTENIGRHAKRLDMLYNMNRLLFELLLNV